MDSAVVDKVLDFLKPKYSKLRTIRGQIYEYLGMPLNVSAMGNVIINVQGFNAINCNCN